jgi:sugar/nucleoside kinase (ribokinase family)
VTLTLPKYRLPKNLFLRPKDILVHGLGKHEMIIRVSEWPTGGGQSNVDIEAIHNEAGGSGMNVAATASRLGGQSALVATLGAGIHGQIVWDEMIKSKVQTKYLRRVEDSDGSLLVILTRSDGDWMVMQSNDKSVNFTMSQVPEINEMKNFKILHIDGYSYIDQNQRPIVEESIARARQANCLISIDTSVPATEQHSKYVLNLFAKCDIVFLNETEARNITNQTILQDMITTFQDIDIPLIALKLGSKGSILFSGRDFGEVPPIHVPVVDTIGAGDSYAGAMLLALCKDYSLHRASLWGTAAGSLACLGHGSLSNRYTLEQLESIIKAH